MSSTDKFLLICLIIFLIYLAVISIFAVYQTKYDKKLSQVSKESPKYWRVPEEQLLLISALGGSFAMYYTMKKIHHKTKHYKFMIGIPVIMILQLALLGFILWLKFFR